MPHDGLPVFDRIDRAAATKGNPLVLGVDPRPETLPPFLLPAGPPSLARFARLLLEAAADLCVAAKFQVAFFERFGPDGLAALVDAIALARQAGLAVIGDVKRGDIASTAEAYAEAYLGCLPAAPGGATLAPPPPSPFRCDAITVHPYLGGDSLLPFLQVAEREGGGVFVVVRSSNPGAEQVQGRLDDPLSPARRLVALLSAMERGRRGFGHAGAVVGATLPAEIPLARELLPQTMFLLPGVGAQGGEMAAVAAAFRPSGGGALVSLSRALSDAWRAHHLPAELTPGTFVRAAARAARAYRDELLRVLERSGRSVAATG